MEDKSQKKNDGGEPTIGQPELSEYQKAAIDIEIDLIASNPGYLQKWDDVKEKFLRR